jgi:hypothetical protein
MVIYAVKANQRETKERRERKRKEKVIRIDTSASHLLPLISSSNLAES